jgi:DNA-binding MarR family transcriptional regulator
MKSLNAQENTYWQLIQLALRSRHDFARFAEREYGLTGSQMHTLCLIEPEKPVVMSSLSCQMACDASNITGIVDRLSAQGYLERKDDPADRRVKMVGLTQKGTVLRKQIMAHLLEVSPVINLTPQEHDQLRILLAKALLPPQA